MSSAAARLQELKKQLADARDENLKAVEYFEGEPKQASEADSREHLPSEVVKRKKSNQYRKPYKSRTADAIGSVDEAEGEDCDERLRGMKRRGRAIEVAASENQKFASEDSDVAVVKYGSTSDEKSKVDRMVEELEKVERRRAKYRRRRAFDEDRNDISFINEGNRIFNRTLDRHFDKFESVKKVKDSLERGTS